MVTQLALEGWVGLAGTRWGGLGLFLAGWGWDQGVEDGNWGWRGAATFIPGQPQGTVPQRRAVSQCQGALAGWAISQPLPGVAHPAVWPRTSTWLSLDRSRVPGPVPKRPELIILELTLEPLDPTQMPREGQRSAQSHTVGPGIPHKGYIAGSGPYNISCASAVNSWRDRPPSECRSPPLVSLSVASGTHG